jgi:hypothetical protein
MSGFRGGEGGGGGGTVRVSHFRFELFLLEGASDRLWARVGQAFMITPLSFVAAAYHLINLDDLSERTGKSSDFGQK